MIEYISQHWYVGVALVLLAILTVFMFIMAIISGRKRNAERERIIAEIEREKSIRKEFREIDEDTFAPDRDDYRLVVGICANIQMSIEKIEDMNSAFSALAEEKKLIYALGYVFEDSRTNLSEFFRANGEPLLSVASDAVDRIVGGRMKEVFDKERIMLDENDETTSVDNDLLEKLDEEYKLIVQEEGSRIYANAASFIRRNKDIFLQ
jgi:hypothetical protein